LGISQLNVRLREAGYTLLIQSDDSLAGPQAAQHWSSLRPAALVTDVGFLDADSIALLHQVGTVVLEITHRRTSTAPVPRVMLDDSALGEVAVAHLIERGCRDIAMLIPQHPRALLRARIRLAGVKRALRAAKNKRARIRLVHAGNTPTDAVRLAELWRKQRPEGVFGFDDEHSGMLLGALQDAGIRIPDQMALVGADDQPLCEMLRPKLTSVALDLVSMRERFVGPILSAIAREWTQGTRGEPWDAVLKRRDT
jgi:DNA-binding LacI/PurR family transcriptional regulator